MNDRPPVAPARPDPLDPDDPPDLDDDPPDLDDDDPRWWVRAATDRYPDVDFTGEDF